jgi:ParB-like chromosome segregation protein Spo0J
MAQQIVMRKVWDLRPYAGNARTHSRAQIEQIARSIQRFGFTNPVLISSDNEILAGHGRVAAAGKLGWAEVPTLLLDKLSGAERRAYVLADNKLALNAGWDQEILAIELQALVDLEFDVELTGFSLAETDLVIDEAREGDPDAAESLEDQVPRLSSVAISRQGDVWVLGRHRLVCGDARDESAYNDLLGDERVDLIFTDPPYNVPIDGNVCGLGKVRHREFAMAVGEMSQEAFKDFLEASLIPAARRCRDGAIAFVCMDWRHMGELLIAGSEAFDDPNTS